MEVGCSKVESGSHRVEVKCSEWKLEIDKLLGVGGVAMGVKGLLSYILEEDIAERVELSLLVRKIYYETGQKPKLLCDFFNLQQWFWTPPARLLWSVGDYPLYAGMCGPDFHLVTERAQSFVKALRFIGAEPVFFVDAPQGCDDHFEGKLDVLRERHVTRLRNAYQIQQVCEKSTSQQLASWHCHSLVIRQIIMALKEVGAEMIFCTGEADPEIIRYAQTHEETCGILSDDSDFAITNGCILFPVRAFDVENTLGLTKDVLIDDQPGEIISLAVSPAGLASALHIREDQLPDLAVLSGTDYTRKYIKRFSVLAELGVEGDRIEDVAKWLENKDVLLLNYQPMKELCGNHPELRLAIEQSYANYSLQAPPSAVDTSPAASYASPVFNLVKEKVLGMASAPFAVAKHGIYWLPLPYENVNLGKPCITDLLRPYRKILYTLLGVREVREYGRTTTQACEMRVVPACTSTEEVESGIKSLHSLREMEREGKLVALYRLYNVLSLSAEGSRGLGKLVEDASKDSHGFPDVPWPRLFQLALICCGLKFIVLLNKASQPTLDLSDGELDALLVSCLTCATEGQILPHIVHVVPSMRSVTVSEWFSHILGKFYSMASLLGLTDSHPEPRNVFYAMAFVPYHLVLESHKDLPEKREADVQYIKTAMHTAVSLPAVKAFRACIFNTDELQPLPQLTALCHAALNDVMENERLLLPHIMAEDLEEPPAPTVSNSEDELDLSAPRKTDAVPEKTSAGADTATGESDSNEASRDSDSDASTGDSQWDVESAEEPSSRPHVWGKDELPIMEHREKILELISRHQVVCIEGETGCGKSSQVPQFILDQSQSSKILTSQPNLLAARKLAERVAEERKEPPGVSVFYCDELEEFPRNTRLTYGTTAYMLQTLLKSQDSCSYTHVILDEVHERSTDIDFAMLIIRQLASKLPELKVVLMSATLQGPLFVDYFRQTLGHDQVADPYFVGIRRYPVQVYFIDELSELVKQKEDEIQNDAMKDLKFQVLLLEKDPLVLSAKPEVSTFAQDVCINLVISQPSPGDAILVFLPGLGDILDFHNRLVKKLVRLRIRQRFHIFALHNQIPVEEQNDAFKSPKSGMANIIISNNMAESSLTIVNLKLVINFGIRREMVYNTQRRKSELTRQWCSLASCTQREGRTGRVSEGTAVHLMKRSFYGKLPAFNSPEIISSPLSKTLLKAKKIGKDFGVPVPSQLLSSIIEPPSLLHFEAALYDIVECGAIDYNPQRKISEEAELTLLGKFCISLPLDLNLCRFIFLGVLFGCPLDAIVMAASISMYQDIFTLPTRVVIEDLDDFTRSLVRSTFSRLKFDSGCYSKPIMVRNMFIEWLRFRTAASSSEYVDRREFANRFCHKNAVRLPRLLHFETFVADIARAVAKCIPHGSRLHYELSMLASIEKSGEGRPELCSNDFFTNEDKAPPPKPRTYVPPHMRNLRSQRRSNGDVLHFCKDYVVLKALIAAASPSEIVCGERACVSSTSPGFRVLANKCMKIAEGERFYMSNVLAMDLGDLSEIDTWAEGIQKTDESALQKLFSRLPRGFRFSVETKIVDNIALLHFQPSVKETTQALMRTAQDMGYRLDEDLLDYSTAELSKVAPELYLFWQFSEVRPVWEVDDVKACFPHPFHPCALTWYTLNESKQPMITDLHNFRNPTGLMCQFAQPSHPCLAVATKSFLNPARQVFAPNITVLPPMPQGLMILLAFQLPTAELELLVDTKGKKVKGLKVNQIEFPCENIEQYISVERLARVNKLRMALSVAMSLSLQGRHIPVGDSQMKNVHKHLHMLLGSVSHMTDHMTEPHTTEVEACSGDTHTHSLVWEMITPGKLLDSTIISQDPQSNQSLSYYPEFRCSLLGSRPYSVTPLHDEHPVPATPTTVQYKQSIASRLLAQYFTKSPDSSESDEDATAEDAEKLRVSGRSPSSATAWRKGPALHSRHQDSKHKHIEVGTLRRAKSRKGIVMKEKLEAFRSGTEQQKVEEEPQADGKPKAKPEEGVSLSELSIVEQGLIKLEQEIVRHLQRNNKMEFLSELRVQRRIKYLCTVAGISLNVEFFHKRPSVFQVREVGEGEEGPDAAVTGEEFLIILDPSRWEDVDEEEEGPVLTMSMRLIQIALKSAAASRERYASLAAKPTHQTAANAVDKGTQTSSSTTSAGGAAKEKEQVSPEPVQEKVTRQTSSKSSDASDLSLTAVSGVSKTSSSAGKQVSKEPKKDTSKPLTATKTMKLSDGKSKKPHTSIVVEKAPNLDAKEDKKRGEAKPAKKPEQPAHNRPSSSTRTSTHQESEQAGSNHSKEPSKKTVTSLEASKIGATVVSATPKKKIPGTDEHLALYLVDYVKRHGGETRLSALRKEAFPHYANKYNYHKYGGYRYLKKGFLMAFPEYFELREDEEKIIYVRLVSEKSHPVSSTADDKRGGVSSTTSHLVHTRGNSNNSSSVQHEAKEEKKTKGQGPAMERASPRPSSAHKVKIVDDQAVAVQLQPESSQPLGAASTPVALSPSKQQRESHAVADVEQPHLSQEGQEKGGDVSKLEMAEFVQEATSSHLSQEVIAAGELDIGQMLPGITRSTPSPSLSQLRPKTHSTERQEMGELLSEISSTPDPNLPKPPEEGQEGTLEGEAHSVSSVDHTSQSDPPSHAVGPELDTPKLVPGSNSLPQQLQTASISGGSMHREETEAPSPASPQKEVAADQFPIETAPLGRPGIIPHDPSPKTAFTQIRPPLLPYIPVTATGVAPPALLQHPITPAANPATVVPQYPPRATISSAPTLTQPVQYLNPLRASSSPLSPVGSIPAVPPLPTAMGHPAGSVPHSARAVAVAVGQSVAVPNVQPPEAKEKEEEWHSSEESWLSEDEFDSTPGSPEHVARYLHSYLSSHSFPFGCAISQLDKVYQSDYKRKVRHYQLSHVDSDFLMSFPKLFRLSSQVFLKLREGVDHSEASGFRGRPYTPEHVNDYYRRYLGREGVVCSLPETQHVFEQRYKKEFKMPPNPLIWFVGDTFFKRSFHIFVVFTEFVVFKC